MTEAAIKQKIKRRFTTEQFVLAVELPETADDIELMIAQEMVNSIDKNFGYRSQKDFVTKMQVYRESQNLVKAEGKKTLGQSLTPDGLHYLLALYVKIIQDNSGLKEKSNRRLGKPTPQPLAPKLPINLQIATSARKNQDSFDYYEESEEQDVDYFAGGP